MMKLNLIDPGSSPQHSPQQTNLVCRHPPATGRCSRSPESQATHPWHPPLRQWAPTADFKDFVAALYDDFQDHGSAAIAACRVEKPDVYVRVIASLLPKDVHLKVQSLDELTDDQLLRKCGAD